MKRPKLAELPIPRVECSPVNIIAIKRVQKRSVKSKQPPDNEKENY